ncbi:MAG: hypothetical protein IKJ65_09995, partial [Clostridia bacterium]|nr:hypothetical protein [Clostridia bacterium]
GLLYTARVVFCSLQFHFTTKQSFLPLSQWLKALFFSPGCCATAPFCMPNIEAPARLKNRGKYDIMFAVNAERRARYEENEHG